MFLLSRVLISCYVDFHPIQSWEIVDHMEQRLVNGTLYKTTNVHFMASIGYHRIYPAADLTVYVRRTEGHAVLHRVLKENAVDDNGRYSLSLKLNQ